MTEDEKFVREQWADVALWDRQMLYGNKEQFWEVELVIAPGSFSRHCKPTQAEAWSAAAEFTRTRLQQIRDVEEEIAWLGKNLPRPPRARPGESMSEALRSERVAAYERDKPTAVRVLDREQAALAELKRGLRVAEERTERCAKS